MTSAAWRVGMGYDVHRLADGRRLILAGVEIPYHLGLEGFSDADVVLHALIDALFGAAALGDIGQHFPPGDARFKGISSLVLLEQARQMIEAERYLVGNVDITVTAEQPRILPFVPEMRKKIADALNLSIDQVSIKGKTTEGLGFTGRGEGIAAYAVACLERIQ